MALQFFPNLPFGWAYLAVLGVVLTLATYRDLKFAVIPKWITVTAFPIGVLFNVVRCAWLAHASKPTWLWTDAGTALGALDGLLFALAGFLFGFVFFTSLWMLGVAGGGDVKLCAAIGAWVGPMWTLWIIVVSIVIVFGLVLVQGAYSISKGSLRGLRKPTAISAKKRARRLLTFSTPLCLATVIVLAWKLHKEIDPIDRAPATVAARSR